MTDALGSAPRSSFIRYWTAATISSFGSPVTGVAMPVLVVQLLDATPFLLDHVFVSRSCAPRSLPADTVTSEPPVLVSRGSCRADMLPQGPIHR